MIISHKHKFIFVHNRKVAGSSVQSYLSRFLGPTDLMIGCWGDAIRYGVKPNRQFVSSFASRSVFFPYVGFNCRDLLRPGLPQFIENLNRAHKFSHVKKYGLSSSFPSAFELRERFHCEWSNYFKFCFVRNTYRRVVSDWVWRTRHLPSGYISLEEYLLRLQDPHRPDPEMVVPTPFSNWNSYTIDNKVVVDFCFSFETLLSDVEKMCDLIGIPFDSSSFPHAKRASSSSNSRRYPLSSNEIDLIDLIFSEEIGYHGFLP